MSVWKFYSILPQAIDAFYMVSIADGARNPLNTIHEHVRSKGNAYSSTADNPIKIDLSG